MSFETMTNEEAWTIGVKLKESCPGIWMPGMLGILPEHMRPPGDPLPRWGRVTYVGCHVRCCYAPGMNRDGRLSGHELEFFTFIHLYVPDVRDSATRGILLGQARARWDDPGAHVVFDGALWGWRDRRGNKFPDFNPSFEDCTSETNLLVAVIIASDGRERRERPAPPTFEEQRSAWAAWVKENVDPDFVPREDRDLPDPTVVVEVEAPADAVPPELRINHETCPACDDAEGIGIEARVWDWSPDRCIVQLECMSCGVEFANTYISPVPQPLPNKIELLGGQGATVVANTPGASLLPEGVTLTGSCPAMTADEAERARRDIDEALESVGLRRTGEGTAAYIIEDAATGEVIGSIGHDQTWVLVRHARRLRDARLTECTELRIISQALCNRPDMLKLLDQRWSDDRRQQDDDRLSWTFDERPYRGELAVKETRAHPSVEWQLERDDGDDWVHVAGGETGHDLRRGMDAVVEALEKDKARRAEEDA